MDAPPSFVAPSGNVVAPSRVVRLTPTGILAAGGAIFFAPGGISEASGVVVDGAGDTLAAPGSFSDLL